jgi:hypothetical protein
MWKLWPPKIEGVFHLKYIITTDLAFLACAFLPHIYNPQFDPIWFAYSFYLFTYMYSWAKTSIVFGFFLWWANLIG